MVANSARKSSHTQGLMPRLILKVITWTLLIASIFWSGGVQAQNFSVTVSRDANNYYTTTGGLTGVIKTQICSQFVSFDQAILQLFSASTGKLTFSNGQECTVVNVFEPATLSPGTYNVTVNSDSNGYFELSDGSLLLKASGNQFANFQSAILSIQSAINGSVMGTIDLGTFFPFPLTNIWRQRLPAVSPTVDLALTGLDIRTARWDLGGEAITNPSPGTNVYPHLFFDVVGGTVPAIKLYEIRIGNALICDFTDDLTAGSYWVACGPISVPSSDFTLSAILDPNGSLVEVSELNNAQTRTYRVKTDEIFKDRFEQ